MKVLTQRWQSMVASGKRCSRTLFIIRCVFFFLSIGRESTTWPANTCLRIMVCSCVVPSKRVLLQIIFCSCVIGTTFSREKWQIASLSCQEVVKIWKQTWWSNAKTIIELVCRKISWFVSVSQSNYIIVSWRRLSCERVSCILVRKNRQIDDK